MGLRTARKREPNRGRTEPHEPLNRFQPVCANLTEPNGTARTLLKVHYSGGLGYGSEPLENSDVGASYIHEASLI